MNDLELDTFEKELAEMRPAHPPPAFMARLLAAKPTRWGSRPSNRPPPLFQERLLSNRRTRLYGGAGSLGGEHSFGGGCHLPPW
jgi:hypothetical protein